MMLQGSFNTTSSGVQYSSFQGIRYAESPTGSRRYHPLTTCSQQFHRFLAPEPHQPEEGLWDVSSESTIMCPQKSSWYDPWHVVGQEDCLFLNVYVPETNEQAQLPVMVWIHGGALLAGAGTFQEHGPQHLLDKWEEGECFKLFHQERGCGHGQLQAWCARLSLPWLRPGDYE